MWQYSSYCRLVGEVTTPHTNAYETNITTSPFPPTHTHKHKIRDTNSHKHKKNTYTPLLAPLRREGGKEGKQAAGRANMTPGYLYAATQEMNANCKRGRGIKTLGKQNKCTRSSPHPAAPPLRTWQRPEVEESGAQESTTL